MRALGICIDPAGGHPRLYGVLVSGSFKTPNLESEFELRSTNTTPSEQAVELAQLLMGKLPGLQFDTASIRTAAPAPVARRNKAQFSRAHAEGAVLFVLRDHCGKPVEIGDPQALARRLGVTKAALTSAAAALGCKADPAVAALSGLAET